MSRRHHGRPHHGRGRQDGPRTSTGASATQGGATSALGFTAAPDVPAHGSEGEPRPAGASTESGPPRAEDRGAPPAGPRAGDAMPTGPARPAMESPVGPLRPTANGEPTNGRSTSGPAGASDASGCTAPQLRRFIKSRPYVPMHELRRRFAIEGGDDDVTQVRMDAGHVYVGLPSREGALLGELLRGGEIGYELSLDPRSPIVVGVYPMRPVPRS